MRYPKRQNIARRCNWEGKQIHVGAERANKLRSCVTETQQSLLAELTKSQHGKGPPSLDDVTRKPDSIRKAPQASLSPSCRV